LFSADVLNPSVVVAAIHRSEVSGDDLVTISAKPDGVGGCISALDCEGRTIWIADAHRDDGSRFIVHADEKLTAFLELESVIKTGRYNRCVKEKL